MDDGVTETQLAKGKVSFQTEGRLLQELGERLVASAEVALVELIKNAYDADAGTCQVSLSDSDTAIVIFDNGNGMTLEDFKNRWMRIATSQKIQERSSRRYGRRLTGQKGIGRFAVRFLGRTLHLNSVAYDAERKKKTRLLAYFDWNQLDREENLANAEISFQLLATDDSVSTGTTLKIGKLKSAGDFAKSRSFRTEVLKIVSPLEALEGGHFRRESATGAKDPGFNVLLPGDDEASNDDFNLASEVLNHAWARLRIVLDQNTLSYLVSFNDGSKYRLRIKYSAGIANGLIADIRFFPRRTGIFRGTEVDGRTAWEWVRKNNGVAVIDHGFRIKPYGFEDNDWLMLDADSAHNRRNWRSDISVKNFPIEDAIRARAADNPMLNLPTTFQLVGAVFVESAPATVSRSENDLTPSMDREGFLDNMAFRQLVEIVRGGIEYLAKEDKAWLQRKAESEARAAAKRTRADFRAAVEYIQQSPTLTRSDKNRLVEEYAGLAQRLTEVEEYDREARQRLETMSALGVVAGFMTHETTRIFAALSEAISELHKLAKKQPSLRGSVDKIEQGYAALQSHLEYTRAFVDAAQRNDISSFKAAPQVLRIIDKFGAFARERGIVVECEIETSVVTPKMPITVYSGILLNLYTNAIKAILAGKAQRDNSKIVFRGWNDPKWHFVEVLDTGVGIPPNLRGRIWDPLFTTTSRLNNPLGSGMGLGLPLVKQLVTQIGGRIDLVDAPAGFSTCFQVKFPWKH